MSHDCPYDNLLLWCAKPVKSTKFDRGGNGVSCPWNFNFREEDMMKTKKFRVLALALIAALIATLYTPISAYADGVNGSVNSETGQVVVGTPIDQTTIDITFYSGGSAGFFAGWYHSDDLSDPFASMDNINGLSINGHVNYPIDGHYTAQISGTPTTAGTIYLHFRTADDTNTIVATWTLTISPAGGGAIVPGGGAVVTTGEAEKAPEVVTYIPPCEHSYEWTTITAATATADGVEALVNIECKPWNSFGHTVKDAMTKRPDVTVKASFLSKGYTGTPLKITIPAGRADLFDSNGYLGLCRAGTELGYDQ